MASPSASAAPKRIVLLGATGSVGESTLRVIAAHRDKLELVGIAAAQVLAGAAVCVTSA